MWANKPQKQTSKQYKTHTKQVHNYLFTCKKLDVCGLHFSSGRPCQVFKTLRHTCEQIDTKYTTIYDTHITKCQKIKRTTAWNWVTIYHLSIIVQVRVEAHSVVAGCLQVNKWRRVWIVNRKIYIKLEAAIGIWRVSWTSHQHLKNTIYHSSKQFHTSCCCVV